MQVFYLGQEAFVDILRAGFRKVDCRFVIEQMEMSGCDESVPALESSVLLDCFNLPLKTLEQVRDRA